MQKRSKAPLTNDGFDIAWAALCHRFENKWMLINAQLRILFNLPISTESHDNIKKLQSSVNNSIAALQLHKVDVTNWDCILIYLCSIRLPKITLSMWEQQLKERNETPTWSDFHNFWQFRRLLTLELHFPVNSRRISIAISTITKLISMSGLNSLKVMVYA